MKKLFISIAILLVVFTCFSICAAATESAETIITAVTEEVTEEITEAATEELATKSVAEAGDTTTATTTAPEETNETEPSIFSRLSEAWEYGTVSKLLFIALDVVVAILVTIHRASTNKNYEDLKREAAEHTVTNNSKTNELIDATNAAKSASDRTDKSIADVKRLFEEAKQIDKENNFALEQKIDNCLTAVSEFAKMLQTAYNGSKMPQPVKDMINTSYVKIENIVSSMESAKNDTER